MGRKVADLIKEFNYLPNQSTIEKSDIWNLQSVFWQNQEAVNLPECNVPYSVKKEAIDAMFKMQRAIEERERVYSEMPLVVSYFITQRNVLLKDLSKVYSTGMLPTNERFRLGSIARLQYELTVIDAHLQKAYTTFEKLIDLRDSDKPQLPQKPENLMEVVNDYTHVFRDDEQRAINTILKEYERLENEDELCDIDDIT